MAHIGQAWKHGRRGLSLVETALILPLILLLTFAILEYGWMFIKSQELVSITRRAARMASLPDATNTNVNSTITTLLAQYGLNKGASITMPSDLTAVFAGEEVTVQVTVPYTSVSLTHYADLAMPSQLKASVTVAKEGQRSQTSP